MTKRPTIKSPCNADLLRDAAPAMLEALKACEEEIRRLHMHFGEEYEGKIGEPDLKTADAARTAIAAAEG